MAPAAQIIPHPPQLAVSVAVTTQRPPQNVCPTVHAQVPRAQSWPAAQALLQRPQCAVLIAVTTQRPPQNVCPAGHAQDPPTQSWPPVQALLHAPQWAPSERGLTQLAPQSVKPAVQLQTPPAHTWPAGQRLLQPPQFRASVLGSTQAAHITRGAAQVATHDPSTQACPATHTRPQAPQWAGLLRVSTSQPLASTPSQSARPGLHVSAHNDPMHSALLSGRAAHARPQAPQLATVVSGASQPLTGSPSQSPAPGVAADGAAARLAGGGGHRPGGAHEAACAAVRDVAVDAHAAPVAAELARRAGGLLGGDVRGEVRPGRPRARRRPRR